MLEVGGRGNSDISDMKLDILNLGREGSARSFSKYHRLYIYIEGKARDNPVPVHTSYILLHLHISLHFPHIFSYFPHISSYLLLISFFILSYLFLQIFHLFKLP